MTISDWLLTAQDSLKGYSSSPKIDSKYLLSHVLKQSLTWLRCHDDFVLDDSCRAELQRLLERRRGGEPVAYIIGSAGFWSLELMVNEHTLIPRPESELFVEYLLSNSAAQSEWVCADFGTGSGAIALALAVERPKWTIVASDKSAQAVSVAKANAAALGLQIGIFQGYWGTALASRSLDVIVANPPYIAEDDPHLRQGDLRFEPITALVAGDTGLADLRQIIIDAQQLLKSGGLLLLEHGFAQGKQVAALLAEFGFIVLEQVADLAGHIRMSVGKLP